MKIASTLVLVSVLVSPAAFALAPDGCRYAGDNSVPQVFPDFEKHCKKLLMRAPSVQGGFLYASCRGINYMSQHPCGNPGGRLETGPQPAGPQTRR